MKNKSVASILIVGLGQLGLPVAKYVKERGFDTYGYDISPKAVEMAQKTAAIEKAVNFGEFDVFILCVSTHKADDMFSPQIEGLLSIVEKISKEAKTGALVSIESTIPKGTSKKVFEILNHRTAYLLSDNIHALLLTRAADLLRARFLPMNTIYEEHELHAFYD